MNWTFIIARWKKIPSSPSCLTCSIRHIHVLKSKFHLLFTVNITPIFFLMFNKTSISFLADKGFQGQQFLSLFGFTLSNKYLVNFYFALLPKMKLRNECVYERTGETIRVHAFSNDFRHIVLATSCPTVHAYHKSLTWPTGRFELSVIIIKTSFLSYRIQGLILRSIT